jgi:lipopolysaccharide transport system ATP-binding protein
MPSPVLRVDDLWKTYTLGVVGTGTLRHDVHRWWRRLRGAPDPYTRVEDWLAPAANSSGQVAALRGVSFEAAQGEVLGIIGRNGAGKSTLLKVLSRITAPTRGEARIRGRMASLLEVGTGFHPELTGRENTYLNGAILGMRRDEVRRKLDAIAAFAEIDPYLDTPVKRYSSGMYVRLAFAVAAHLDPDILIVDEVLAVGDVAFQKKCTGKLGEAARDGRTVLFVSHNMGAISALTTRCLLLRAGALVADGPSDEVIAAYIGATNGSSATWRAEKQTVHPLQIAAVEILDGRGRVAEELDVASSVTIQIDYEVRRPLRNAVVAVNVHAADGAHVLSLEDSDRTEELLAGRTPGTYRTRVTIPGNWLRSGSYVARVGAGVPGLGDFDSIEELRFTLIETGQSATRGHRRGYFVPMLPWELERR